MTTNLNLSLKIVIIKYSLNLNFFFWWIKSNILKEKRHTKDAPQSIQVIYKREKKEPLNQSLTNLQNPQRKGGQSKKKPLSPYPKITKEKWFTPLNWMPIIFKSPTISFLPNNPKKTQGRWKPHFFPLLSHTRPKPPQ